jgi:hypothetical protein
MSYLNPLRLHFAGQFQANVSSVNNDPDHFHNAAFDPSYQLLGDTYPGLQPLGWFNPEGDAAFRLVGCQVTSAWTPSAQVQASDPVLACIIADSDRSAPAKLVDLDPEQQLVSEIYGLQVRIADAQGNTLLRSRFEVAAFIDIWTRATGSNSDTGASAAYQSVLTDLEWADVSASPFLTALREAASDGLLSIKFNVDGLSMEFTSPNFMRGRIVGTIGPATADEPRHLVLGRQFMADMPPTNGFPVPKDGINFFPGRLDAEAGCIFLDLGNALSTAFDGGPLNDLGDLQLSAAGAPATPGSPAGTTIPLGEIPSTGATGYATDPTWYARTAGVVALPLTAVQIDAASSAQLVLTGNSGNMIAEWSNGAFVRADRFVYRMSANDTVAIPVYATQWGRPLAGAALTFEFDNSQLQSQASSMLPTPAPQPGSPESALPYSGSPVTDAAGMATLSITAADPGTPRWFNNGEDYGIDGQVYGRRPAFADPAMVAGPINQWNFVSFLVWSNFPRAQDPPLSDPVTWNEVQPIFQQYANLYPVMLRFLNLADYDSVVANARLLRLAFGLDPSDPNAMPVTRDLSPAKRAAIMSFLTKLERGPDLPAPPARSGTAPKPSGPPAGAGKGGKAAAMARRVAVLAPQGGRS